MPVKKINDRESFDQEILSEDVLIKFEADWCGPCKAMSPILEDFAKNNPKIKVISVDIEGDGIYDVLGDYQIKSVPTFVRLKGGTLVKRASGTMTRVELLELAEG